MLSAVTRGSFFVYRVNNMWYVYILECKNRSLYTGITNNLERRLEEHKNGKGGKFTHAFKANKLMYSEPLNSKNEALKREALIKSWTRKKKQELIAENK
jgi:putative endonuclease